MPHQFEVALLAALCFKLLQHQLKFLLFFALLLQKQFFHRMLFLICSGASNGDPPATLAVKPVPEVPLLDAELGCEPLGWTVGLLSLEV